MAFVALAMCLLASSTVAESPISQNAAVRRHASLIQARPARRSVELAQGQRLRQKRQTAEQIAQAAALKAWDDDFHAKNAEWQQAALAALAKGQTPPSYDEYWNGKSSGSDTSSGSNNSDNSGNSSGDSSNSNGDSSNSSDESDSGSGSASYSSSTKTTTSSSTPSATASNVGDDAEDCSEEKGSSSAGAATSAAKQLAKVTSSASKTSVTAAPTTTTTSSSAKNTGDGTYFDTGLGACGKYNTNSDHIVAVSHLLFDSFGTANPNNNPVCGHKIKATYQGKSTIVTVADRCAAETCAYGDLDFTPTAFQELAPLSVGRLHGVSWQWIGDAPHK